MIATADRANPGDTDTFRHFTIGAVRVSVRSDLRKAIDDFAAMYPASPPSRTAADKVIRMEVKRARRTAMGMPRYTVCADGQEIAKDRTADEVLPYLEWGINWRVSATRSEYLQLHSATMVYRGQGFVFAGPSGAGKSTLVAGLLARGWKYCCDEFALIDPDTLYIHPFPKAVCIKAGSFNVVKQLNLKLSRNRHYVKAFKGRVGYVSPTSVDDSAVANPSPIRTVIHLRYTGNSAPRLYRLPRAKAAFVLAGQVLNRDAFGYRTMSVLNDVVRQAACFGLESGRIDETCQAVESLANADDTHASSHTQTLVPVIPSGDRVP